VCEARDGSFDVRVPVPGVCRPAELYARLRQDRESSAKIGAALGALLAQQHTRIGASEVRAWLPAQPSWPLSRTEIEQRLPRVIDDAELQRATLALIERYQAQTVADSERVLAHCDLGVHNIAVDPDSFALAGVFDYEGAAWADRHHDFRYLVFDFQDFTMLDAACAAYEAGGGAAIERERVLLYNAACAVSYLADRAGAAPDERPAGRTLAEDLHWIQLALARLAAP
jgi:aminoglycoside phosphotransferase (APT) family kinase protein